MERNSESQAKNGNKRTARNEKNVKKNRGSETKGTGGVESE